MTEFLGLLAIYYTCDATAAVRPLTGDEVAACMSHYEAIKAEFYQGPVGPAANAQAFRAFKAWEAENAETVARLRAGATP